MARASPRVDLYAKAPGQSSYTKVASTTSTSSSGSFSYTAAGGDGSYGFYTIATDQAANVQATPATPNTTTLVDTTPPTSNASSPALSNSTSLSVSYTASDSSGGSGLAKVDLYAKAPGQSSYTKVASTTSPNSSGSFSYTAAGGDGSYSFYTTRHRPGRQRPGDTGHTQHHHASRPTLPTSKASAPASATYAPVVVSYTASDNAGGSGLARVDLYAKGPGTTQLHQGDVRHQRQLLGQLLVHPRRGQRHLHLLHGGHRQGRQRRGRTGHAGCHHQLQTGHHRPHLDGHRPHVQHRRYLCRSPTRPRTTAAARVWHRSSCGLVRRARAATSRRPPTPAAAASGSFSYTAAGGEGSYAFYTIAVDLAGNREAAPNTPDATTIVDTLAPSAFQMTNPGQYLRATVKPSLSSAPTDGGSGMASVTYQYRVSGTTNPWSTACTVAAPPWSCNWNTATKTTPDGLYDLLALAADKAGNTTVASNTPLTGITTAAQLHALGRLHEPALAHQTHLTILEHDLLKTRLEFKDGGLDVPNQPGIGVELDHDAINHYADLHKTVGEFPEGAYSAATRGE